MLQVAQALLAQGTCCTVHHDSTLGTDLSMEHTDTHTHTHNGTFLIAWFVYRLSEQINNCGFFFPFLQTKQNTHTHTHTHKKKRLSAHKRVTEWRVRYFPSWAIFIIFIICQIVFNCFQHRSGKIKGRKRDEKAWIVTSHLPDNRVFSCIVYVQVLL